MRKSIIKDRIAAGLKIKKPCPSWWRKPWLRGKMGAPGRGKDAGGPKIKNPGADGWPLLMENNKIWTAGTSADHHIWA